ncbi:Anti-repressor SinI [Halobacillus dabanensis]|uniref:Anti-repressor SinI n=1 Tax=Halobacillus dabanensis TaxID=240302 RepID=A0A1I3XD96_HALDA|nr:anti-repressor SinI family protein [Halobacillus dabanensis]SFK17495.1 Anti-repressor SinI [Halobacillus dabanensis]
METLPKQKVDCDWVHLLEEARELGLSIDEIREFLRKGTIR